MCIPCRGAFFSPKNDPQGLPGLPQDVPGLPQDVPELAQRLTGGNSAAQVAEITGRIVKNRGLGILCRIYRIYRILIMWWQPARPRPYLPHAPGVRMT